MDFATIAYDLLETDRFSGQIDNPIEYNTLLYDDFCDWYQFQYNIIQSNINLLKIEGLISSLIQLVNNFNNYCKECIKKDFQQNIRSNKVLAQNIHFWLQEWFAKNLIIFLWKYFPEFEQSANYSINPLEQHLYIQFKLDTTSVRVYKILKDHPIYSYLQLHVVRLLEFWMNE